MMITSLKSVSLGLMTLANHVSTTRALELSRIEEDYQAYFFGRVEGAHDLDEAQLSQNIFTSKVLFDMSN
jgi:chaperone required for assembly of F1-ATPase